MRFNYQLKNNDGFLWLGENDNFNPIKKINSIPIDLLIGIENQKKILLENTNNFANGNLANSALLWGTRGNGKSTLIKSVFNEVIIKNKKLKLIQINKNNFNKIENLYNILFSYSKFRFILYIDDLSFQTSDNNYNLLKSILDGSIKQIPNNVILYVTSNKRHLISKDMIDNERSSAIHTNENIDEKVSLSDRFGIWLGFHSLSQHDYINIVKKYCDFFNINYDNEDLNESIKWALQRGNRTGRSAWQFIIDLASKKNININN